MLDETGRLDESSLFDLTTTVEEVDEELRLCRGASALASGNLQSQKTGNLLLNGPSESRVGLTEHRDYDISDGQFPFPGSSVVAVVISLAPPEYIQYFVT